MENKTIVKNHCFSESFQEELAYLLNVCRENHTDGLQLNFAIGDLQLDVDIRFDVHKLDADSESEEIKT